MSQWVAVQEGLEQAGCFVRGIDDRSYPEHQHEENTKNLGDIPEKDIQTGHRDGNAVSHDDLKNEQEENQSEEPGVEGLNSNENKHEDDCAQELMNKGRKHDAKGQRLEGKA